MAEEADIDLVEIAPMAKPPVCRLMDYGKFKYRESKKAHEAKLKQKQIQVKEVKFRPGTDEGDYKIKVRNLTRFLTEGDKTKVTLRFRGREMAHQELGVALLKRVEADLAEETLRWLRALWAHTARPAELEAHVPHGHPADEILRLAQEQSVSMERDHRIAGARRLDAPALRPLRRSCGVNLKATSPPARSMRS